MTAALRRIARRWMAAAFATLTVFAVASPVAACSSEQPTFEQAVTGAEAIALVTILAGAEPGIPHPGQREVFHVDRVLKGALPEQVTLEPAIATLCHDSIGFFAGSNGRTVIVAFGLPYYDQVIHPVWTFDVQGGLSGSASVPFGATTLADVEAAIVTAVGRQEAEARVAGEIGSDWGPLALVVAVPALVVIGVLRYRTRQRQSDV